MHKSSLLRMQWFIQNYAEKDKRIKVLDVGSYNVNGCYRELFDEVNCDYQGLDMEAGPNVDIVPKSSYVWDEIKDEAYDIVVSGQAFEHIEFFWITLEEIVRVTRKGGLICLIAPNGFEEHRYPVDCWRFFTDGMVALARYFKLEVIHAHTNSAPDLEKEEWFSKNEADSMIVAKKVYSGKARKIDLRDYKCTPTNHRSIGSNFYTYSDYLEEKERRKEVKNTSNVELLKKRDKHKSIKEVAKLTVNIFLGIAKRLKR